MEAKQLRYTIRDFNKQFPDDDSCLDWLKNFLNPNGVFCETCNMITPHSRLSKRKAYSCNRCGSHYYPMANTIFERSRTSLKMWFYATFLISHTRCGISAKQLQRELGVTYKTAWRMFHQIRLLLQDLPCKLSNKVEVDETYIGGVYHTGHKGRLLANKTTVIGMAQRHGRIKAFKVSDLKKSTVMPLIKQNIDNNALVYTDEFAGHRNIWNAGYRHKIVNHGDKQWVCGDAHTNNIEGFWSQLKRSINGVYHVVGSEYLQNYVNEYAFRYNHRKDYKPIFWTVLENLSASR